MRPSQLSGSRRSRFVRPVALAGVILLLLAIVVAGCGGAAPVSSNPGQSTTSGGSSAPAAAPAAAAPTAAPAAAAPAPAGAASGSNAPAQAPGSLPKPADVIPLDRMVIRNAKITLQVSDVELALARVRDVADIYSGYVSNSHTYFTKEGDQDRMVADITIAVRSDSFDKAVANVRQVATKVENEDGTSQDVTDEYVDLDANLRNLQASEDAILKLTDKATKLEDVLTLQRELANVRGQIEKVQGRKNLLEHQSSISTIAISMHLPPIVQPKPVPPPAPVWNPLKTFERGWQASIVGLQTLADVLISIVAYLWWTIPFIGLGFYLYGRNRQRRPIVVSPPPAP